MTNVGDIGHTAAHFEVLPAGLTIPQPDPVPVPDPEPSPDPIPEPPSSE